MLARSLVILLLTAVACGQVVRHVPAQFPTIQGAIVAALPGDVVCAQPWVYAENLELLGKAITVQNTPCGTLGANAAAIGAQLWIGGSPPVPIPGFPELHIDQNAVVALGPLPLGPTGLSLAFNVPGAFPRGLRAAASGSGPRRSDGERALRGVRRPRHRLPIGPTACGRSAGPAPRRTPDPEIHRGRPPPRSVFAYHPPSCDVRSSHDSTRGPRVPALSYRTRGAP